MGINAILSGLQKTLLNNAVQSKAPNPKTQINVNPETVQRAGLKAPLPSEKIQIGSPNVNLPSPQIQQTMMGRQPNMKDVALIVGTGEKANNVANSAGFQFLNAPDPQKDPAGYFKYRNDEATKNLIKLGLQKDTAVADMNKVVAKIKEVYASETIDKLQQKLLDIIEKGQPKQQFTSARDFFIETDKSGKERLSNRGVATLTLAALAGLFGNPTQTSQTTQLVMGLGDKYAKEKNLFNEAKFKADVADYNNQIQKVQTGISIATQEQQRKLAPLQMEYSTLKEEIKRIDGLTDEQRKSAEAFGEKIATIAATADTSSRKTLMNYGLKGLTNDDPNVRVNSWLTLRALDIDVEPPFKVTSQGKIEITPTIGQRVKETQMEKAQVGIDKVINDIQMDLRDQARKDEQLKLDKEKFGLEGKKFEETKRHHKKMEQIAGMNANTYARMTDAQKNAVKQEIDWAKKQLDGVEKSIKTLEDGNAKLDSQEAALSFIEDKPTRDAARTYIKSQRAKNNEALYGVGGTKSAPTGGFVKERDKVQNYFKIINPEITIPPTKSPFPPAKKVSNTTQNPLKAPSLVASNKRMPGKLPAPSLEPMGVNAEAFGLPEGKAAPGAQLASSKFNKTKGTGKSASATETLRRLGYI